MKKFKSSLIILICLFYSYLSYSQSVIYSQDFGTNTGIILPTGWGGTWSLDAGTPSNGYTGASGGNNAMVNAGTSTLIFGSISTIGYNNISVMWGSYKQSSFMGVPNPTFAWSTDSITWTPATYTNVSSGALWGPINYGTPLVLPAGAAGVSNLYFRWSVTVIMNTYRFDDFVVTGTPTSTLSASKLKVVSVNAGSNPDSCHSFNVVVQSQDVNGFPVNTSSAETVTLSKLTGTGSGVISGGTGTIASGSNSTTISVSYSNVETGVSLLATGSSLTADTSNVFNVLYCAAGVSRLKIVSVNNGNNPDSCHAFNVVVQSQDVNGNPVNVTTNEIITLTKVTGNGTGTLSGGTGTIGANSNSVTISVGYSNVETGVSIKASGSTLMADTSNVFNVQFCTAQAVKLAIPTINNNNVIDSCTQFSVVVQSLDLAGNPANVLANTNVVISVYTGFGTPSALIGTLTGTIIGGTSVDTIFGVSYNKVESGIRLLATRVTGDMLTADYSNPFNVIACPLGVNTNDFNNDIKIYPNPVNNTLYFNNITNIDKINITNVYGQQVKLINNVSSKLSEISVNELPNGIYIITFYNKDGNSNKLKFTKQ